MVLKIRSRNVVLPDGVRPASIEIRDGRIASIGSYDCLADIDAGDRHILPGLVDTHVHVNEPGRAEWEGFRTAMRAAAAGGYTTLVDMPLNSLPATTTVENLHAKESAARGQCLVDYGFWGGVVADNQDHIAALAEAGVLGYKCFLIHPGIHGFTMVDRSQLEAALPAVARSGLPLLTHAELPGPIEAASQHLEKLKASSEPVDVASVVNSGRALAASDEFFGSLQNLILPGRPANMGGGWETRRRRGPGYDWIIVQLGVASRTQKISAETEHYKGNCPDRCSLDAWFAPQALVQDFMAGKVDWKEILPASKLEANAVREFDRELQPAGPSTHVRLNIYPDGGISRLRVFGKIVE